MELNTRLILALDVTIEEEALRLAEMLAPYLDVIKVNYPLVLSTGMQIVEKLSRIRPVLCDFKVADIPNTNRLIVERVSAFGAMGVIVHGFTGPESLKATMRRGLDVFVVAEMTHPGSDFFPRVSEDIVDIGAHLGVTGFIAPATKPERLSLIKRLSKERSKPFTILSPGVGAQGGKVAAAIEAGADALIVGRSLYESEDPEATARDLIEQIQAAESSRPE